MKDQKQCIVTIWFWVGIRTHPRHSSSPLHICAAIYSGSTSLFDPCQAHFIWATTPSGRFRPYTIRPVRCHQSTIFVAWDTAFFGKEDKVNVELWNQRVSKSGRSATRPLQTILRTQTIRLPLGGGKYYI